MLKRIALILLIAFLAAFVVALPYIFGFLAGLGFDFFPCVREYKAESIEGTVVDASTKQPLEGVVVVANWKLMASNFGGSHSTGQLHVLEAVTDKAGKYRFPSWGPKPKPSGSYLHTEDPQLLYFKPGYKYRVLVNDFSVHNSCEKVRRSRWNQSKIEMTRFVGTLEKYAWHLQPLRHDIHWAYGQRQCEWKQIPNMIAAVHEQALVFGEKKLISLKTIRSLINIKYDNCGVREYFKEYLK